METTVARARMLTALSLSSSLLLGLGCEKGDRSYSLLSDSAAFQQSATYTPRKIDILWIIDNSGSMSSSQSNLVNNFSRFISRFQDLNYDFRMGVNATDAWLGRFNSARVGLRRLRDGAGANHSGVFVMDRNTPAIENVFLINATQGILGTGDERAFQSIEDTLNHPDNADFRRPDAFLAVIIVSDEDDFSGNIATPLNNDYNHPSLIPVSYYKNMLDQKVGLNNWSVNAITIMDSQCQSILNAESSGRLIGNRYLALADLSNGAKTSLCGDFGQNLELISDLLIEVSSSFKLDREPLPATIRVLVNGQSVVQNDQNGWSYNPNSMILTFNGTSVPPAGAQVMISFDPAAPKN